jgi:tricorn protease
VAYLRFPTINGASVVFGCEDDLWTVPATGGVARRLTSSIGVTSHPALSPDGSRLAFISYGDTHPEVLCMPAEGGPARRLTYLGSASTAVIGWARDGRILATSSAGQPFGRWTQPLAVDPDSGVVERLPIGPLRALSHQPDGVGVVLTRNSIDPARWKRYGGGTAGQIWVDRRGDGNFRRVLADLTSDLASAMWVGNRIYFVSDHEGIGNLYSVRPTGSDLRRHTDHDTYYARLPSTDGEQIVYQHAASLWRFDPGTDSTEQIEVETASPQAQRRQRFVPAADFLTGFSVHPTGREVGVETRGQQFVLPLWEDAPRPVLPQLGARQRLARWLPDGETFVTINDDGGEEALWIHDADGDRALETADLGHVWELTAAPVGVPRVAVVNNRNQLLLVDIGSGRTRTLDASLHGALTDASFSPDGRWIAYSCALSQTTRSIKVVDTESGDVHLVTRAEFRDVMPAWDPAGRFLYFLSSRTFDPVPDELFFDLNFPQSVKLFVVPLRVGDRSPFDDVPHGMAPARPDPSRSGAAGDSPAVTIDVAGLDRRAVAAPLPLGRYLKLAALTDSLLLLAAPIEGSLDRDIFGATPPSYSVEKLSVPSGKAETLLPDVADFAVSADRSTIVYQSKRRLRALPAGEQPPSADAASGDPDAPGRATGWLDLDRIRVSVEPISEWRQMYREAWRLQREYFWDAGMSGVDWELVHDRYLPLLEEVASRAELTDVIWELQGELGTSHAYEIGADYGKPPAYPIGLLGADLELDRRSGRWRITHIVRADHWDPMQRSPLEAPGVEAREGDTILAVNGQPVDAETSPATLLVNQAGTAVELTLGRRGRRPRTVIVTTAGSEQPLRYREWVEDRRRYVHEATDGRVGYLHVPNMGTDGYAEFHRSYLAELPREALIVDVRDNGGGFVSAILLERLARRRIGYDVGRHKLPESYPPDAPAGPLVCITNENAGSDGDIFSHGFKMMGMGPLIGTRTWGGVIGIDGRHRLVDGSLTTQPQFSFWFNDVGWGVENYGTDPDVVVDRTPQDWAAGRDPQLDKGLQLIQTALRRHKPKLPANTPRASLALPVLPPRP